MEKKVLTQIMFANTNNKKGGDFMCVLMGKVVREVDPTNLNWVYIRKVRITLIVIVIVYSRELQPDTGESIFESSLEISTFIHFCSGNSTGNS